MCKLSLALSESTLNLLFDTNDTMVTYWSETTPTLLHIIRQDAMPEDESHRGGLVCPVWGQRNVFMRSCSTGHKLSNILNSIISAPAEPFRNVLVYMKHIHVRHVWCWWLVLLIQISWSQLLQAPRGSITWRCWLIHIKKTVHKCTNTESLLKPMLQRKTWPDREDVHSYSTGDPKWWACIVH